MDPRDGVKEEAVADMEEVAADMEAEVRKKKKIRSFERGLKQYFKDHGRKKSPI